MADRLAAIKGQLQLSRDAGFPQRQIVSDDDIDWLIARVEELEADKKAMQDYFGDVHNVERAALDRAAEALIALGDGDDPDGNDDLVNVQFGAAAILKLKDEKHGP